MEIVTVNVKVGVFWGLVLLLRLIRLMLSAVVVNQRKFIHLKKIAFYHWNCYNLSFNFKARDWR
jgi:hypothetical protein